MAIYKPTYCYPYGGNVDFCVDPDTKAIYLQCKLNTSNKKVTGYKLTLVDNEGKVVWEPKYISPVDSTNYINFGDQNIKESGFNGDTLIVPFVQNLKTIAGGSRDPWLSANCLYANIDGNVDFFIETNQINYDNIARLEEVTDWNNEFDNSSSITIGDFFVRKNGNNYTSYVMNREGGSVKLTTTGVPSNLILNTSVKNIHIKNGVENHDSIWSFTSSSASQSDNWLMYIDEYNATTKILDFNSLKLKTNSQYSWKVILYQGNIVSDDDYETETASEVYSYKLDGDTFNPFATSSFDYVYFSYGYYSEEYDVNQYDILVTQGQILGSTGTRLQIYPADVILQKKWVQLGHATFNSNGIVTDWFPISTRTNIQIYDSLYGHIYPSEGNFAENILEQNQEINACMIYKYSNNPNDNLESDMVRAATVDGMTNTELDDILYHIFNGGLITIDDIQLRDGDLVLLKDLTGYEYLNGVYSVSSSLTGWKRSGSYTEWSQFLGKILLVKEGAQNGWHNFQSQAQVGGVIGSIMGSGINANHPTAGYAIFKANVSFASSPTQFTPYYYENGSWSQGTALSLNNLISQYKEQYIFMFENSESAGSAALTRFFIPLEATSFADLEQNSVSIGDILAVKELTPSFGFISVEQNSGSWTWDVNNLSSQQKGSELFFIPEQPIILYPNYENLSIKPNFEQVSAVYIGNEKKNSPYILQYDLESITGSTSVSQGQVLLNNIPQIKIDSKTLNVADDFLGIYQYIENANYNYTQRVDYVVEKIPSGTLGDSIKLYELEKQQGNNYYTIKSLPEDYYVEIMNYPISTLEYDNSTNKWSFASYKASYVGPSGAQTPRITRIDGGLVEQGTRVIISDLGDIKVVLDGNNHLIDAQDSSEPVYYLGNFTILSKVGDTTWNLRFANDSSDDGGHSGGNSLPNKNYSVAKGEKLGGINVMLLGTYSSPIVQYGVTNRIGKLNINTKEVTYIKPTKNINPGQYIVFTEVETPERKILEPIDYINYGVNLEIPYIIGVCQINNLLTLLEKKSNYWTWRDETNTITRYTVSFPIIGSAIYYDAELINPEGIITDFSSVERYSSVINASSNEPYKYKIVSYFKDSDYNPVIYSGEAKIGFDYIRDGDYSYNTMSLINKESHAFVLGNSIYGVVINQQISISNTDSSASDILLRGYYRQGNGKRWEYYRMALFNEYGNVLQDTGNVYNGDFSQYFWGLKINSSRESDEKIIYALLIVEDEFSKIYTTGIKIFIDPIDESEATAAVTKCKYNYNLQSVDIELTGLSANYYTLYRKEKNSNTNSALAFDDTYHIVDRFPAGAGSGRLWNIRDYNITNNRKYEYYLSEDDSNHILKPLNSTDIVTSGKCWSIANLYPTDLPIGMENSLTIKKKYLVDENNVWLFKYNGEFGSQTQNIAKSEQGTLGQYPRIGQGMRNNQTGSISALLGSEIIPGKLEEEFETKKGYQERLRSARGDNKIHFSSNESIDMLEAWRTFVQSKNPKLLKDVKGQSWIVQITSNQNTPMAHVQGQPDTISFSWIQIGDTKDISIVGSINKTLTSDY